MTDTFVALSDPTRRLLLDRLSEQGGLAKSHPAVAALKAACRARHAEMRQAVIECVDPADGGLERAATMSDFPWLPPSGVDHVRAYAEAVAEAERLVEEERVRILQMQEAAKQNRARTVGEARRLVSEQYSLANNAKAFKASAKEASPSWLLWE